MNNMLSGEEKLNHHIGEAVVTRREEEEESDSLGFCRGRRRDSLGVLLCRSRRETNKEKKIKRKHFCYLSSALMICTNLDAY
jgi:hypothetical protein